MAGIRELPELRINGEAMSASSGGATSRSYRLCAFQILDSPTQVLHRPCEFGDPALEPGDRVRLRLGQGPGLR